MASFPGRRKARPGSVWLVLLGSAAVLLTRPCARAFLATGELRSSLKSSSSEGSVGQLWPAALDASSTALPVSQGGESSMPAYLILAGMTLAAGAIGRGRRRGGKGRLHSLLPRAGLMDKFKQSEIEEIGKLKSQIEVLEKDLASSEERAQSLSQKLAVTRKAPATESEVMDEECLVEEDVAGEVASVVPALVAILGWLAGMYVIQHRLVTIPFLAGDAYEFVPIALTFVAGYATIVLEEVLEISKAATALLLGVLVWALVGTGVQMTPAQFSTDLKESFEDVSEVVFFLLGALTIVEIMDAHKGFDIITKVINATKCRDLLVVVGLITFALSSVLNNLTVVIVMISLMQKLIKDTEFRLQVGGVIVVASNAGGAWTPIGDITSTMLYLGGQVTTAPLIGNLLLPSVLCALGTIGYEYFRTDPEKEFERPEAEPGDECVPEGQALVFWTGLFGMILVPVFTSLTQCPAWSGMMLVLGYLGVVTSIIHKDDKRYSLAGATSRIEVPDALFFLGILFAVGGLEKIGLLKTFAVQLGNLVPSETIVAILLGLASSVVDNVPLVAATQGMYDMTAHPANSDLWNLICYCAATGGSLLVIGSAAGVAFLGLEKEVSFGWYVKNVTPGALLGYIFGVAGIAAQQAAGLQFT